MVQIENITLKNILENLDDARKYQSLRELLRNIPAVDLAPTFETLPKEKMPILFRLCRNPQRPRRTSLTAWGTRNSKT